MIASQRVAIAGCSISMIDVRLCRADGEIWEKGAVGSGREVQSSLITSNFLNLQLLQWFWQLNSLDLFCIANLCAAQDRKIGLERRV